MHKYIIVVPARAGSKGIKNKNIKVLNGKPLIKYTLDFINNLDLAKTFDAYVATDMPEILKMSEEYIQINFVERNPEFAKDESTMDDFLYDFLINNIGQSILKYNYVILLQPSNPIRTESSFQKFLDVAITSPNGLDTIISALKDNSDLWTFENAYFRRVFSSEPRIRQLRKGYYVETGTYYFIKIQTFLDRKKIVSENVELIVTSKEESIDINNEDDFNLAEYFINKL